MLTDIAYLLLGLGAGAVFAALALALVVTYRSSGVVNFGASTMALFSAYFYANLREGKLFVPIPGLPPTVEVADKLPFVVSLVASVLVSALLGGLLYLAVFRPLRRAPPLSRVVASVGVMIALPTLVGLRLGSEVVSVRGIFPKGSTKIGDTAVQHDRLYLALTIVVLTAGLSVLFRVTRFGLVTRAVAESEKGAVLSGIAPQRIALANWVLSGAVAGLAGILIAPIIPLVPVSYTLFIVPALAAAVLGGFTKVWPTVIGGLAIGMLQSELQHLTFVHSWLPRSGSPELVPLVLIFAILWRRQRALPERGEISVQQLPASPRPRRPAITSIVATGVALVCLLAFSGVHRAGLITSFIFGVIALSMVLLTGYTGTISLAQLVLAGVAGFSLSTFTTDWSIPFPIAPILAAAAAAVCGVVVGLPALRLRGLTFAILTMALAVAINRLWFQNPTFSNGAVQITGPELFGVDLRAQVGADFDRLEFGVLALVVLVGVAYSVALIRRSRLGGRMLAVRANERSAAAVGIDVARTKITAFAMSAFIAGIGGALLAYQRQLVGAESYEVLSGLALFAFVYITGITSVGGGILAGILAPGGLAYVTIDRLIDVSGYYQLIAATGLVAATVFHPSGIAGVWHEVFEKVRHRRMPREEAAEPFLSDRALSPTETRARPPDGDASPLLSVRGLTVRYGGMVAVSNLDLDVPPATIVGLIGPNGAGKTTAIDAISGFVASGGRVELFGNDISRLPPHRRTRAGLGRTFQAAELWEDLTVGENLTVATTGSPSDAAVVDPVELFELREQLDAPVASLSHGQRRIVSIARALAGRPRVLLLDEPAAGLDSRESAILGERLRAVCDSGVAILLVDHDMSLVLRVCDQISVLDFGVLIAAGTAYEITSDSRVAAAYLGDVHSTSTPAAVR